MNGRNLTLKAVYYPFCMILYTGSSTL